MKKVFLLLGLTGCTAAFAQQDIFDVQKHLQNQQKATTRPALPYLQLNRNTTAPIPSTNTPPQVYMLSNGDSVFYGFGKMPVIKPGTTLYNLSNLSRENAIPGSNWPGSPLPGEMPNAARPFYNKR